MNPQPGAIHSGRNLRTATVALAGITALAWLITYLLRLDNQAAVTMGFIPARWSGLELPMAAVPTILTPLTATLVHGGFLHLLLNLLILLWCGTLVERVLGAPALVLLYLIAAYAAALAQWAVMPFNVVPVVGASGAISGIIGAFALSFGRPRRFVKSNTANQLINAAWLLAAWIVLQLMTGMLGGTQGLMVATAAHVGGFIAGLVLQRPLLLWRYRGA